MAGFFLTLRKRGFSLDFFLTLRKRGFLAGDFLTLRKRGFLLEIFEGSAGVVSVPVDCVGIESVVGWVGLVGCWVGVG